MSLRPGMCKDRDEVIQKLIEIQYNRNEMDFQTWNLPGAWRCVGGISGFRSVIQAVRIEFFGDEVDRIVQIDVLTGEIKSRVGTHCYFPGIALCCAA